MECRHCRMQVRRDLIKTAARCPHCRLPLYEKPETQRRPPASAAGLGSCLLHPHNDAIGRCRRCNQLFCGICRTRWHDDLLCMACFNQVLETNEKLPRETQLQRRQALTSVVLAVLGWVLLVGSGLMLWSMREGQGSRDTAILTLVVFLVSFVPALVGLGQATATLRSRGERMVPATWGLVLASLQIGLTIGVIVLNITHN